MKKALDWIISMIKLGMHVSCYTLIPVTTTFAISFVSQYFHKFFSYSDKKAYGQSKLANILHANELSRRLKVLLLLASIIFFM